MRHFCKCKTSNKQLHKSKVTLPPLRSLRPKPQVQPAQPAAVPARQVRLPDKPPNLRLMHPAKQMLQPKVPGRPLPAPQALRAMWNRRHPAPVLQHKAPHRRREVHLRQRNLHPQRRTVRILYSKMPPQRNRRLQPPARANPTLKQLRAMQHLAPAPRSRLRH